MKNMNNMDMDNMNNITLYFCGTYLLINESEGGSNCMFHAVGDLDVVISESSHDSLQINCMNQIMEMYKADPFLLSPLYQSNRPWRMLNVDLPKYLDLQRTPANGELSWTCYLLVLCMVC